MWKQSAEFKSNGELFKFQATKQCECMYKHNSETYPIITVGKNNQAQDNVSNKPRNAATKTKKKKKRKKKRNQNENLPNYLDQKNISTHIYGQDDDDF